MHIPGHVISNPVAVATSMAAIVALSQQRKKCFQELQHVGYEKFAYVSALIFVLQMLNFPVQSGTSGHLVGGVLAVSLLGVPAAFLSIAIVLTLQTFLFGDGAISTLGVNFFNMAVITAGLGGYLLAHLKKYRFQNDVAVILSSWASVVMAALACAVELALSHPLQGMDVIRSMVLTYGVIGLGEAALTLAVFKCLSAAWSMASPRKRFLTNGLLLGLIVGLSPLASSLPDGLETVLSQIRVPISATAPWSAVLESYHVPGMSLPLFSTYAAVLIGIVMIAGVVKVLGIFSWGRRA